MALARTPDAGPVRRALFAGLLLLLVGTGVAATVAFALPTDYGPRSYVVYVGSVDDFAPGTATMIRGETGRVYGTWPDGDRTMVEEVVFHLVRLPDGQFLALSAKSPHLGCTVVWRPNVSSRDGAATSFFEPCHGETYDLAGRPVFGPGTRSLDRYAATVMRDGRIRVDLGAITRGEPRRY